jgi:hypothetical protein
MSDDGLRGVAFHEAGHAVVALALGLNVARVEIFEDNAGRTAVEPTEHLPIEDRIAICVAGMAAADMFDAPPSYELADLKDQGDVRELLYDIDEASADELRDKGDQRAWDLLKVHANSVEDIAARSLAERKIDLTGYALKPA